MNRTTSVNRRSVWLLAAALTFFAAGPAQAQVHRCVDATGKTTFSDSPCSSGARSSTQVLGSDATDRRWENEAYGRERNMRSIENASRIIQAPTSDAMGDQGGGIIHSDPNERIRAQDERNMRQRQAQIAADEARQAEREERRRRAAQIAAQPSAHPRQITNCSGGFCYDSQGGSYMRNGDTLLRNDGRTCREVPGLPGQYRCN